MKIALVQFNTIIGNVRGNSRRIIHFIQEAKKRGADLVCFHEMTLLGYPPRDLLLLPYVIDQCQQELIKIAQQARGIAALVGTVDPTNHDEGRHLFNAAAWCEDGVVKTIIRKSLLPTYDVFDETRYFNQSKSNDIIDYQGQHIGVTICEDIWNDPEFLDRPLYPYNPVVDLIGKGSRLLINLSASPYSIGKIHQRRRLLKNIAQKHGVTVAYVNQVGGNDELIFDGGSMVVNPQGETIAEAACFKEEMIFVDLECSSPVTEKKEEDLYLLEQALILGLKDYVRKCGFKKVALGLSGGVDSALTAYLAARALGSKNVLGLMMPSRYSSKGSLVDSKKLAQTLNIPVKEISIKDIHLVYEKSFKKMFGKRKADTTEENVQARIRGNLLMAVSNKLGHLVLTTGNKSEIAVGYSTLYGDMSGGLAVISDLPKTLVYKLCQFINRKKEVIPYSIINKPPSAELKPNQVDQDSLPPYDILDGIIKAYIEELKSEKEIIKMGYKPQVVQKVLRMIHRNEYKRRQAPPGLRVTSKAFGMGRRFPIACKM